MLAPQQVDGNRGMYPLTALLSIVWLGVLAEVMLESVNVLGEWPLSYPARSNRLRLPYVPSSTHVAGDLLHVTPVVMGLTIGAWGASMPTLWSRSVREPGIWSPEPGVSQSQATLALS